MTGAFSYKNGELHADACNLTALAAGAGTPFYVYSATALRDHLAALQSAFATFDPLIAYAMKANANQAVLTLLAKQGAGADVVSGGELQRALQAGIAPQKIVFSGVAKTEAEMRAGLEAGIHCFNLESEPELDRLERIAAGMDGIAPVSVRINPDIDAKTHAKISTGSLENKFGIPFARAVEVYARIATSPHLDAIGVDMHIGSQITDLSPFDNAFALLAELVTTLRAEGHAIAHADIGGGLGIAYDGDPAPDLATYAAIVEKHLKPLGCGLTLEPGRYIAGNAGALITKVEYLKRGGNKNFLIVDAGMNDLIRPTLYEAHHEILPVKQGTGPDGVTDVVGPVCETGDYLALDRLLPQLQEGNLVAVMGAGAYGAVMAGTYNTRPLIAEVLVDGDRAHAVRPRQTIEDLINLDSVPDWL